MAKRRSTAELELAVRVGARIRQVRMIQHISQSKLAKDIGICVGPLGWIESGKHLASGRVLYRIAKQLNVRIDDLFSDDNAWESSAPAISDAVPVLLPPLDTEADAGALKAAHVVCQSVAEQVLALEDLCGAIKMAGIPLYVPFTPTEAGAEHLAARVRQNLGIGNAIVYDYLELFENAGLCVVFMEMPADCETFCGYDRLNRNAFFFINSLLKKQPELQMYRLVFELGRIFWHTRTLYGAAEAQSALSGEPVLDEAQFACRFATCFLMPAGAVLTSVCQLGLTSKAATWAMLLRLKKRYGVSVESFVLRLQELKLSCGYMLTNSPQRYHRKSVNDPFYVLNSEPGGFRPQLAMNGRLGDLLLQAAQKAGKNQKAVNALKRGLRQNGVKLEG
jgi:transcriptional regulator with XRE-family HTH domain/Zn-dependent peptidase ImmA (M78 family)